MHVGLVQVGALHDHLERAHHALAPVGGAKEACRIELADQMLEAGLVRMPERWFDVWRDGTEVDKAMACNADPGRPANVHFRPLDSPVCRDTLLLRDWLRANPDGAAEYAALKRRLAEAEYSTMDDYAVEKTPWVNDALVRAEEWAERTGWHLASQPGTSISR
jgi:dephospho-CoA kinase